MTHHFIKNACSLNTLLTSHYLGCLNICLNKYSMIVETIFKQIIIDIENLNPELVNKIKNYLKRHDVQYQIKFTKKRESLIH